MESPSFLSDVLGPLLVAAASAALGWLGAHLRPALAGPAAAPEPEATAALVFRHLIENAPDFVTLADAEGKVRFRSPALQRFLGPDAASATFAPIHPADEARGRELIAAVLPVPGSVQVDEVRFRRYDGEWRWLELVVRNLTHEPSVKGLLVYSRDVTERRRADERQELRVKATRLLANSPDLGQTLPELLQLLCRGLDLPAAAALLGGDRTRTFAWPDEASAEEPLRLARRVAVGGETWTATSVAAPIRGTAGLRGALALSTEGRHALEPGLLALLSEMGLQVGQLHAREHAERALLRSEERMRVLVEHSADGIALFDHEARIVWTAGNDALGYSRAEVAGRPLVELVHPEDLDRLREFFGEIPDDSGRVVQGQFRLRHKDGSWRWLEGSLRNLLKNPAVAGVVANYRDVTERLALEMEQRRLQEDLARAAAEWRLTFDAIASPVLVVRAPRTLVRLNAAGHLLAGRPYEDLVGRDIGELGLGEPWRTAALLVREVAETREPRSAQVRAAQTSWEITANLLSDPSARDSRVIVVARDVTETVELQASVRRSETLSAMGSLVAGVAHEVRNPLFSIGANLDALGASLGEEGPAGAHFEVLRAEMARLNVLMQDLLEYGKPSRARFEPMALADVVRVALGAVRAEAERAGVVLTSQVPPDVRVDTDRGRLARVFQNLVENAVQHAPPGTAVAVRAERSQERGEDRVLCAVEDSGPGFAADDLPRVFEPFFTRRRGGTGLGLPIVARIVEEHDGRVQAGNRAEGGARVVVDLPARPAEGPGDEPEPEEALAVGRFVEERHV